MLFIEQCIQSRKIDGSQGWIFLMSLVQRSPHLGGLGASHLKVKAIWGIWVTTFKTYLKRLSTLQKEL